MKSHIPLSLLLLQLGVSGVCSLPLNLTLPHQASPATLAPTRMKPDHRPFAHLHYESDESAEVVEERVEPRKSDVRPGGPQRDHRPFFHAYTTPYDDSERDDVGKSLR
ncbi:hypothetical protein C8J57DRAFT_1476904 [Mycena rebaudengoi]|nr:hypothetical protein C8J57DRAFT_1476904 [Mycena rebaudengoi]